MKETQASNLKDKSFSVIITSSLKILYHWRSAIKSSTLWLMSQICIYSRNAIHEMKVVDKLNGIAKLEMMSPHKNSLGVELQIWRLLHQEFLLIYLLIKILHLNKIYTILYNLNLKEEIFEFEIKVPLVEKVWIYNIFY